MLDVINILLIDLSLSYFFTMGMTLSISPTLEPWNQMSFPLPLFNGVKQNFSVNLDLCSLFLIILKKIMIGEKISNTERKN